MELNRRELLGAGVLAAGAWSTVAMPGFGGPVTTLAYDGAGIYLYPGWGEPRPYLVRPAAGPGQSVEFCDLATQSVLWTQSLSLCGDFAGKLS